MSDFCRSCGASIPHRHGEGRCPSCVAHDPVWAQSEIERLQHNRETMRDYEIKLHAENERLRAALERARREAERGNRNVVVAVIDEALRPAEEGKK